MDIPKEKIKIYNDSLKKQNIGVLPILPTCQICGSEIVFNTTPLNKMPRKVIALTGTCASGKTSTAEVLMQSMVFRGLMAIV